MERSTIITLRGERVSGVARIEQHAGGLDATFSLRPQQQGAILAFFICPGRVAEVPLAGNMRCRLDEPLTVEGILLAHAMPEGLGFFAEGGALHAHLNFPRIKEQIRISRLSSQPAGSKQPAVGKHTPVQEEKLSPPAPMQMLLPRSAAAPERQNSNFPPAEVSGRDQKAAHNALQQQLNEHVPPGASRVSGEEHDPALPPPRSRALKEILDQARTLYPANHAESPIPEKPAAQAKIPPLSRGHAHQGSWDTEVNKLLRSQPAPERSKQKQPPLANISPSPQQMHAGQRRKHPQAAGGVRESEPIFNPFPEAFPRSCWKRVRYPGTDRYYLEGEVLKGNTRFLIHALPGEYAPVPQRENRGFTKFMRASDGGGYWLRIRRS